MKRIVIFASGSGSNAENIIKFFSQTTTTKVTQVLCNNEHAKVFERCKQLKINCLHFNKTEFSTTDMVLNILKNNADFIVLAGFLWKIPQKIIDAFPNKIINIHPALLPKYGGKGMYGMHVHKAVKENKEIETGITIHYVNANYDEGAIIFQAKTALNDEDTKETIAKKIHILEQRHFPSVIEGIILEREMQ
ncbi:MULTISPECIES: phosphoribosylglycinamide formyltransferase [unclassified Polaribacter]|uniref:phosphoribosylglycinamide formyltransferase n=1 Tax=unclassified Polaribacter TaxID=196858 RepID=UPI0011BD75FB|nr:MULTISPECIES: phosphoribosylglycinamide formyltransferase [unclassified Polaribacter]TXD53554.1 phosphoribosylglycinamide formyltransferase [Polaribacter sp. IC063]TXD58626.1 phosphoribosylglycinamide formyltransferase [Polaribacter sp. IC066]